MRKLLITTKVLFIAIILSFIVGCGGGGSSSVTPTVEDVDTTAELDTLTSSATNNINGTWLSDCIYSERETTTFNNNSIQTQVSRFSTNDCSGIPTEIENFYGTVEYVGTQATSICIADKINIKPNNSPLYYGLVCIYRDRLYWGLVTSLNDGSSFSKRPDEMDLSFGSTRI